MGNVQRTGFTLKCQVVTVFIPVREADVRHARQKLRLLPRHEQNIRKVDLNVFFPHHTLSTAAASLNLAQVRTELSLCVYLLFIKLNLLGQSNLNICSTCMT